jgi:hypothetical protein
LADNDGLTGKELAPSVGQFLLHRGKIGQPEAIEQFWSPMAAPPYRAGRRATRAHDQREAKHADI